MFQEIAKRMVVYIIPAVFLSLIDRIVKTWALFYLDEPIRILGDIFSLDLALNFNIAFSIPISGPIVTSIIALIVFTLAIYYIYLAKNRQFELVAPLTFVLFGAMNNLIDRLMYGFVVDYFDLKYFTIFNLADVMIVSGVAYILLITFKKEKNARASADQC